MAKATTMLLLIALLTLAACAAPQAHGVAVEAAAGKWWGSSPPRPTAVVDVWVANSGPEPLLFDCARAEIAAGGQAFLQERAGAGAIRPGGGQEFSFEISGLLRPAVFRFWLLRGTEIVAGPLAGELPPIADLPRRYEPLLDERFAERPAIALLNLR